MLSSRAPRRTRASVKQIPILQLSLKKSELITIPHSSRNKIVKFPIMKPKEPPIVIAPPPIQSLELYRRRKRIEPPLKKPNELVAPRKLTIATKKLCPVCSLECSNDNVVVLSCGHILHHSCINGFRRISRLSRPLCPVCHLPYRIVEYNINDYEKNQCAMLIQRVIRGYLVRKSIHVIAPTGSAMHKKWVLSQAQMASVKLTTAIENQSDIVDAVLYSIDAELEWARSIMKAAEIREREIDWDGIKKKQMISGIGTCPICLQSIDKKECEITSCGHCFHTNCLQSWNQFCAFDQKQPTCPQCRSFFQHQPLCDHCHCDMNYVDEFLLNC